MSGEGLNDPVLQALRDHPVVTVSHEDCFHGPNSACALAWSKCDGVKRHCEAFRVGEPEAAVYGFQFHPEPTLEMLKDEREGWRWFEDIPDDTVLAPVVEAGGRVLRAWAEHAASNLPG